ncbi:MAG: DUF262 domain-containing protein [Prevotella sp.]|nr:DUF262 domain-containing protein [Prevotella sp.]
MSNRKYNFEKFLDEQGYIRIPKIQRDYAQGRESKDVNEIRKSFVHTLMLVVKGKKSSAELDFIYGSTRNDAFEPLDGQQRLTTLFLLHWMMGVSLISSQNNRKSKFTYETRNTSAEFCDELVHHHAEMFIGEARSKGRKVSDIIKARDWFKWEWKFDPTISSMLVMIDSIYKELDEDWTDHAEEYRANLNNITFNRLNLGEFGLSDELFIKMNARGKLLSDFDKLKSTLEEELQIQQKEIGEGGAPLANAEDEKKWRSLIDGEWIDLFWHKYAREIICNSEALPEEKRKVSCLNAAKLSEMMFKRLLLRMISLELLERKLDDEALKISAYSFSEDLFYDYDDSLSDIRSNSNNISIPSTKGIIKFGQLIQDINVMIYKQDNQDMDHETTSLLPQYSHIDNNNLTLFDNFLNDHVGNDVKLIFYAMLLFLRNYPMQREEDNSFVFRPEKHKGWIANLTSWVRIFRNILLNDNNNQRIDRIEYFLDAMRSIQQMDGDFKDFVLHQQIDIEQDKDAVIKFFASLEDKTYVRIDNQSLGEEIDKAKLQLKDREWVTEIQNAEKQSYLWGQIRCILSWSEGDIEKFRCYQSHLFTLLDYIQKDNYWINIYTLILAVLPECWRYSNRLYVNNKDRDNSFKRCLRDFSSEHHVYGYIFKQIIDQWMVNFGDCKKIETFVQKAVDQRKKDAEPWLKCILNAPVILYNAWNRRIFSSYGHVVLPQRKTLDSHCYDPIFLYLKKLCEDNNLNQDVYEFYDSKSEYGHAFRLTVDNEEYLAEWSKTDGSYTINREEHSTEDLLEFFAQKIKHISKS